MATLQDLRSWLERDLARFGKLEDHLHDLGRENRSEASKITWKFCIYTDNNCYSIRATTNVGQKGCIAGPSYLGCIAKSRKPRAGEDWHRGRDMADGTLSQGTWHRILADIVSYEMVRVHNKEEALRNAEIPNERLYPPTPEPTRLTTGDGLESRTESASPTAPSSSPRTPRGQGRRAGTGASRR